MLRFAEPQDAAALAAIYAPFVRDTTTSFEYELPDAAEMERRRAGLAPTHPWIVWDEGEVLGYAYAGPHRDRTAYQWSTEVSVYLAPRGQGRGLGTRLYQGLFAVLRAQGFVRAWAGITLPNDPSEALHRKLGFDKVGVYPKVGFKFGAWRDVAWYGYTLQEVEEPGLLRPPRPEDLPPLS